MALGKTPVAPAHAPGQNVAATLRRSVKVAKSSSVAYGDTSPINLIELPGNCLVLGGSVRVTTEFNSAGTSPAATLTVTAPNDTGTELLWDAGGVGLGSTGYKPFTIWALTPSSGGYIIGTYTANTTAAGAFEVYINYVELDDKL